MKDVMVLRSVVCTTAASIIASVGVIEPAAAQSVYQPGSGQTSAG